MKPVIRTCTFLALVALAVQPVLAQGRGPRGGRGGPGGGGFRPSAEMMMLGLLRSDAIQEEVQIRPDQVEDITKANEESQGERPDMSRLRDASPEEREKMMIEMRAQMEERTKKVREAVQEILEPEQLTRLNEITLQLMGTAALTDPKVVEKLEITDKQKEQMAAIQEETRSSFRELFQGGDREQIREKMTEARKQEQEKLMNVLTEEQQADFKAMQGEPSEAVAEMQSSGGAFGAFGGRGGRGGDRGGRGGRGGDRERGDRGGERGDRDRGGERERPELE